MIRIILLLLVLFIVYKILFGNYENFNRTSGKWCDDCEKKSFGQCLDCFNCGFCVTEKGEGFCTEGNVYGPENKKKCNKWIHNDEFISMVSLKNYCID